MPDVTGNIVQQQHHRIRNGNVVSTVVRLQSASDTVDIPRLSSTTGSAAQVRRPGDPAVTVSITDSDTLAITGGSAGDIVLVVGHSSDPIVNPS